MAFMPHVNADVVAARSGAKAGSERRHFRVPFLKTNADVIVPLAIARVIVVPGLIGALQIARWVLLR
jgi:hypothetical protein